MATSKILDVSRWNLSVSLLALAACGPVIPGADSGDDVSESDPTQPSDPSDPSDPSGTETPSDCQDDSDCQGYGYSCVNGLCEYNCLGCCGYGLVEGDDAFRCSQPYYYCYSDAECGPGEQCDDGYCVSEPADCADLPQFSGELSLAFSAGGPVTKLLYADVSAEGSDQLIIVRDDQLIGSDGSLLVQASGPVIDAIAVDLDADLQLDLITATSGDLPAITVWRGVEGGFDAIPLASVPTLGTGLVAGDWQGDGVLDLFVLTSSGIELVAGIGAGALAEPTVVRPGVVSRFTTFDVDGDARSDLAALTDTGFELVLAADGLIRPLTQPIGPSAALALFANDFDGDGWGDLVTVVPDFNLVSWSGPLLEPVDPVMGAHDGVAIATAAGDIDLDGRPDLAVTRADAMVSVLFGGIPDRLVSEQPFACERASQISLIATAVAIGDHDGDGDRDLAISDGASVSIALQ